jgi:hypothetical protein
MITKQEAVALHYGAILHHVTMKNKDGTPMRVRVSGACKTWKTRPEEFRLPVKYGLRESGYIDQRNAFNWLKGD